MDLELVLCHVGVFAGESDVCGFACGYFCIFFSVLGDEGSVLIGKSFISRDKSSVLGDELCILGFELPNANCKVGAGGK